jgi:hypothetical protein
MKDTIVMIGMIILGLALVAIIIGALSTQGTNKLNAGADAINELTIP